jgi:N-acetylglucosamine-6-phosphate deacetylase
MSSFCSATTSIVVDKLFTGHEWLDNVKIEIDTDSGIISSIESVPVDHSISSANHYHTIMPVLIDLQLYGAYGSLLSVKFNFRNSRIN